MEGSPAAEGIRFVTYPPARLTTAPGRLTFPCGAGAAFGDSPALVFMDPNAVALRCHPGSAGVRLGRSAVTVPVHCRVRVRGWLVAQFPAPLAALSSRMRNGPRH
ncbi:hypothetical protein GCM10010330_20140 [Streptomyces tendae]|nr:hypothetical protein GCM10010330_20140 [Streptomyces tendae]